MFGGGPTDLGGRRSGAIGASGPIVVGGGGSSGPPTSFNTIIDDYEDGSATDPTDPDWSYTQGTIGITASGGGIFGDFSGVCDPNASADDIHLTRSTAEEVTEFQLFTAIRAAANGDGSGVSASLVPEDLSGTSIVQFRFLDDGTVEEGISGTTLGVTWSQDDVMRCWVDNLDWTNGNWTTHVRNVTQDTEDSTNQALTGPGGFGQWVFDLRSAVYHVDNIEETA